ncbi:MAG: HlyD family efflux transporter periplasmic adaptor subunit [bacterium]|nr:HlyD family efflux transporter periplasmic adaptor subunit [bacterium]
MEELKDAAAFRLLFRWLYKEQKVVYKIYFLALLQGVLYLIIPLGIQGIVTYTMAGRFSASLILLSFITIVVTFFIGILQLWQMRLNETLQQKVFSQISDRISSYLGKGAEIKNKLSYFFEIVTLQKGIGKVLLDLSFSVISIIFGLLILPAYSSWFLVFSLLLSFAFFFVVTYFGKRASLYNLKTSSQKYLLFNWLQESVLTKTAGENQDKSNEILFDYLKQRKSYYNTIEHQYKGILVFKVLFVGILLVLGTYLVQIGKLNIGQFVAAEIIVFLVINSVEKLVGSLDTCYDIITALYKIEDIFKEGSDQSFLNSTEEYSLMSVHSIYNHQYSEKIKWIFYSILTASAIILMLPWTQTVDMNGRVSVLNPENKPQNVTSRIAGRIEKWYIKDGDLVRKNDTIAFISEIKEDYVDPQLIKRSESQIKSKEVSMQSYEGKINSIDSQIDALNASLILKTRQVKNKLLQAAAKLNSDSMEVVASVNNLKVVEDQLNRFEDLLKKGVISKTDFENRKVKSQDALSKKVSAENKVTAAKNEILNLQIELNTIEQEFKEKLMKSMSDKYSTMSMLYDAEGSLTKMQNQLSNYSLRKSYYHVLAPQDGYVNKLAVSGVGEIIKEGGVLCNISPLQTEQVAELFVDPVDFPLIAKGQTVQLIFDGWPTFVFSGWPGVSFGAFDAKIIAYDRVISENGKFRILAENKGKRWPEQIQIGGGIRGFALLNNVPLIYEFWRKVNGFPPDFYVIPETKEKGKNEK